MEKALTEEQMQQISETIENLIKSFKSILETLKNFVKK